MSEKSERRAVLDDIIAIRQHAIESEDGQRCVVAPSPELRERVKEELENARGATSAFLSSTIRIRHRVPIGMNDGLIYPGSMFPAGTAPRLVQSAAANRAPLRGVVRVAVILVEFSDKAMGENRQHFEELFFSQGVLENGSVREYFAEVTNNLIDIQGQVVGPYELPLTIEEYANNASGIGTSLPNARTMARDAAEAANPDVNFGPFDNDGDDFVDAFIVVHAGRGAEETGSADDIWSHKWVLPGGAYNADGTNIYAYLTVPEDARIGVCCHELGHLLFGFPDLYDTDYSSEGVGNWCLMGGGSWNGDGDIPAHPSAWCKADQGWVQVINQTTNGPVNIEDVKTGHTVYRLWKNGSSGSEFYLIENRQRTMYDAELPGDGLLIWHIDDSVSSNADETHYKVALEQADGDKDLEDGNNRGDQGDPFPGDSNNTAFDKSSTPNSRSYAGVDTYVAVKNISPSGPTMQATLFVKSGKSVIKDIKDSLKDKFEKDKREKDTKEFKEKREKDIKDFKEKFEKDSKEIEIKPRDFGGLGAVSGTDVPTSSADLAARLAALEARLASIEPFIDMSLRPDLSRGALTSEEDVDLIQGDMQKNAADAKRGYDTKLHDV